MVKNAVSIGNRLRDLLGRSGLTMTEVAAAMGYSGPSSVQRYLAPEYGEVGALPMKAASGFARALSGKGEPPIRPSEIYALAGIDVTKPEPYQVQSHALDIFDQAAEMSTRIYDISEQIAAIRGMPADLPRYGTSVGRELQVRSTDEREISVEQTDLNLVDVVDHLRRPIALHVRRHVYAMIVAGDSMFPRLSDGETVLIDPIRQAAAGEDVVVHLLDHAGQEGEVRIVTGLVKRLVRRTSSFVELEQFNPRERFRIEASEISVIQRIMPWSEVLSF